MDVSTIEAKYLTHKFVAEDFKQAFEKANIEIRFPITHEVLGSLAERIGSIYEGIIISAKHNNLYSAFILYRALLEHFFKSMYIIYRMVDTLSDETSNNYKIHCFLEEVLLEKAHVLEMENLLNDVTTKPDFIKYISSMPNLEGFDKANQQEISTATRQFKLKEIIKYLHNKDKDNPQLKSSYAIIAQTLPEYAHVSTFIHGGPYAASLMSKFVAQKDIENQLTKILQIGLTSAGVIKENFFMTYAIDKSFEEYYLRLQSLRLI